MLLFPEEGHIDRWCTTWRMERGATLTLEQCWRLAVGWYSDDRRDLQWRRKTIDEARRIFAEIGLEGSFWELD